MHKLFFENKDIVCLQCKGLFIKIIDPVCEICCGHVFENQKLCKSCLEYKEQNPNQPLIINKSIFHYTNEIKEWLNYFKFCGDVKLASLFAEDLREYYENYFKNYKIVPVPLSDERLNERGFNQVEELARYAGLSLTKCLKRIHTERQSKLNRNERLNREQIFSFSGEMKIDNESVIILDDVYTTGKTVQDAATILLENGASEVYSLTLIRA
ncbi:ComF family protein [Gottfriedia sp. NPDC056225]|uniref:ComF family protein n=1 Tax=Gottfriedia sp. NPDC056225 TaxID=3345751 RepID=UPI001558B44E|nr:ComF family protein [Arthrobacter citreus]